MTDRVRILSSWVSGVITLCVGCATPNEPAVDNLSASFSAQVASAISVRDFERDGDDLTFIGPDGAGGDAAWLVHIDSAVVEALGDVETPDRGIVVSTWYRDGREVEPSGSMSLLPDEFLERGIAQECWAFWEESDRAWAW